MTEPSPVSGLTASGLAPLLAAGGPVLYILAGLSVLALALVVMKLIHFTQVRAWNSRAAERALALWQGGRPREALALLERSPDPVSRVVETAVRGRLMPQASEALVREEVARVATQALETLKSGLRFLALVASLSPLLGLLGTVIGMIDAFQALEQAGSRVDPSILSGGIWVALLTTAAGLIVAIPAAAAHHWLEGRVEAIARRMEDGATRIFTHAPISSGELNPDGLAALALHPAQ